jgi:hypothetical protein
MRTYISLNGGGFVMYARAMARENLPAHQPDRRILIRFTDVQQRVLDQLPSWCFEPQTPPVPAAQLPLISESPEWI